MPPDSFDIQQRVYITASGRVRSRAEMRLEIDRLIAFVTGRSRGIAQRFFDGEIDDAQFIYEMRELLKAGHVVAGSVGRGGRRMMTARDWGRIGLKLRWQYGFLARFARRIAADQLSGPATMNRVSMYAAALHTTYYRAVYETASERPRIADMPRGTDGEILKVRRILNAKESCPDCVAYEAEGWMNVDEMPLLGTLACSDFCKCFLEFSDEGVIEPVIRMAA